MQKGRIPDAWFATQVEQADRVDGDIDTLSSRIAQIRTWTFVANRPDWLADPEHWQGIARDVENKLSDALHERLTERFVDRRTSVLMRRLRENTMLNTEIGKTGEVIVEGHVIGRLDGFTFAPDAAEAGSEAKALQATAQKALAGEIDARAEKPAAAPDDQFVLTSEGTVRRTGEAGGRRPAPDDAPQPRGPPIADHRVSGSQLRAPAGLTSRAMAKSLPRDGCGVLASRQCGERAVRVDILERFADLIRPALSWRETSPGEKPAGAFDGRSFVVTQAMTSLTGSAGEDFASILRALGYRAERRQPLPPKPVVVETVAAEMPALEGAAEAPAGSATEGSAEPMEAETALPVSGDPAPSVVPPPEVSPAPAADEE